jgi:DNA-directed RNA polymerase specialized sigma subunit
MSRQRHVHLGDRLQVIEKIQAGATTPEEAADELHVTAAEVRHWMQLHSGDRIVSLDEVRVSPDVQRLSRRAQRLVELIENADLTIRILNRMLAEMATAGAAPRDA